MYMSLLSLCIQQESHCHDPLGRESGRVSGHGSTQHPVQSTAYSTSIDQMREWTWVWIPAHQLTSCVTSDKLLLFSGPQRWSRPAEKTILSIVQVFLSLPQHPGVSTSLEACLDLPFPSKVHLEPSVFYILGLMNIDYPAQFQPELTQQLNEIPLWVPVVLT